MRKHIINVFHVHNENRVIAFQRWLEGIGQDVVVAVSLNQSTYYGYRVFNSDVYDNWVNPMVAEMGAALIQTGRRCTACPRQRQWYCRPMEWSSLRVCRKRRICRRQDLNLHCLNGNQALNLARLPIPPLRPEAHPLAYGSG
jgi:hypothetical protein